MSAADPRDPIRIGDVVATSLRVYWSNANILILLAAVFVVPAVVLTGVLLAVTTPASLLNLDPQPGTNPFEGLEASVIRNFILAAIAATIISFTFNMLSIAACFKAVGDALSGVQPSWRTSLAAATSRLGSLVWLVILQAILFIGFLLASGMVTAFTALLEANLAMIVAFIALAGLIYLFVAWSLSIPVVLQEDIRGARALWRSHALVRGRFFRVFLVYLIGFLMLLALGVITGSIFSAGGDGGGIEELVITNLGTMVTQILITPLQTCLIGVVYMNLRTSDETTSPVGDSPESVA